MTATIVVSVIVRQGFAWTDPSSIPPGGSGVLRASGGNIGIGAVTPDANYKITTAGGGIKAENGSATNPAGYFNNVGGGPAITAGSGGITLGGVNQTSWPSSGVPTGAIMSFYLASCPSGWVLANGANSTPDLRGKFVIGTSSTYGYNTTGGEAAHTLTVAEMPSHSHAIEPMQVAHATAPGMYNGGQGWPVYAGNGQYTTAQGGGQPHNNMPPYHSLIYCMKQ